jgi:hypothetical protein
MKRLLLALAASTSLLLGPALAMAPAASAAPAFSVGSCNGVAGEQTYSGYQTWVWVVSYNSSCPEAPTFYNRTHCAYRYNLSDWHNGPTRTGIGSSTSNNSYTACQTYPFGAVTAVYIVFTFDDGAHWYSQQII